jgi:hypothetical protein
MKQYAEMPTTLGFKNLPYEVPSSPEEFDQLAGKEGACLAEGIKNIIYRGTLTDFRSVLLHGWHEGEGDDRIDIAGVEEITGIMREREPVKGKDGKVKTDKDGEELFKYTETEETYFERVLVEVAAQNAEAGEGPTTVDAVRQSFWDLAVQVLKALPFDPKRQERVSAGPKKTPKTYQKIADALVAQGPEQAAKSAQKLTEKLGYQVDPTAEAIGRAITEDKRRQARAEKEKLQLEYA